MKKAAPHLDTIRGGIDLFFESMLPKDRYEAIKDFFKGKSLKLLDKKGQPAGKVNIKDVDPQSLKILEPWAKGKTSPAKPTLEYDPGKQEYVKKADDLKHYMKLYVDMDGVLTDFEAAATAIGGAPGLKDDASEAEKQDMYDKIEEAGPAYWSGMPWKPGAEEMWEKLKIFAPRLLSSPGKFRHSERGKQDWVNSNLPGVPLFLENDKYQWAERDAVLIDDNAENVHGWREAGGIGILHEDPEKTETELLSLLSPSE